MSDAGDLIALALKRAGTSHIFTLNGGHIWPILTGAVRHGIRLVDVRHEQTAAFAAEGWAKVTRSCGVAAVTAGPGVTNSISAIAAARASDSPVFLLGGRAAAGTWGMGALQEMDHVAVLRTLVKSARTLESADQAYAAAGEAVRIALSGRTGPTFLDVPIDVFFSGGEAPAGEPLQPDAGADPEPGQIEAAAALLRRAEQPALVAGSSVWWSHAEEELTRFAEAAGLPTILNGLARGMLPPDHPLFRSRARSATLGQADLVFVVGVPLDFRLNFGRPPLFSETAQIVYVDVDGVGKHRPAAAAVYGNLKRSLACLARAAEGLPPRTAWLKTLARAELVGRERDRAMVEADSSPIHPARLCAEVQRFCDQDAIIVGDGGDLVSFAGRLIERRTAGLWIDAGPFGCLGSGPGYAMAAKLAFPERQVLLLSGDGAFGFSAMEFDTMIRHGIPVVCVVGNNGIWGLEKHPMQDILGTSVATDLNPHARYDRVVQALGGYGELVERPEDIHAALERAFSSGVAACIDVRCDPEARYPRTTMPL
ncbi:MAG TPA: acetolactate synthase [Candidatus Limnocylindrales bacterium]|nr:acetolactate synthase [Candidatus Limnocylindrales bacterium]